MIIWVAVAVGLAAVMFYKVNKFKIIASTVKYESSYVLLGAFCLVEDLIFSGKNRIRDLPIKTNEVAVITGGHRGIGYEVVRKLLECDMHVIIGCRNTKDGENAVCTLRKEGVTTGTAEVFELDLSSNNSVKNFALNVLDRVENIHVLINNAGIMDVPHSLTEDGFESHLAVNYIGHFLLTYLLLPTIKKTGQISDQYARVVHVSSCAHILGSINFDDINYINSLYLPNQAYSQSKLAQLMFSNALDRRMRNEGAKVSSFAVHPGVVNTGLFDNTSLKKVAPWAPKLFFKSPEKGAIPIVYAAVSDSLEGEGGAYISNCRTTWVTKTASNVEKQEKLMRLTLEMLDLNDFGVGTCSKPNEN